MKIFKTICFVIVALLAANFAFAQTAEKNYPEGELLVKFKNGTASGSSRSANIQIGASLLEEFPDLKWQRVKLPDGVSVKEAMERYENLAEVEFVQPNYYYHLQVTPNDAQFGSLWGMAKISAPSAWDLTTGSASVVVAVIDTGIKPTHEDLAANLWTNPGEINGNNIDDDNNGFIDDFYGYDFFFNDSNPQDEHGHGTHTSGTIGAVGNNALGVAGVNWNVKIMTIKIYDNDGFGTTAAMLINAYNYVRMMKNRGVNIRVTNNSYSGCDEACGYDQATKDALDALGNAGILNVFAAGNDNRNVETTPAFPASYNSPTVLSVAASTSTDARSGFSNWGTTSVDLAAPGSGILSTVMNASNYGSMSGTSMASPHAAGAAALLSAYNPALSNASLKATLMNTVDPLAAWTSLVKSGGRLNVDRALRNQTVCNFNLSATEFETSSVGGTGSVNVTAATNCDYSIKSNAAWITVTSPPTGSGNSAVSFTVQTNPIPDAQRVGTITIADRTFYVIQGQPFLPFRSIFDFDGDGRTDFSAIQNVSGGMLWHNFSLSSGYSAVTFGLFADDVPLSGDYDGDGRTDVAVWRNTNGTFYVLRSSTSTAQVFQFGLPGDNPRISQDFDGDGRTDFAVTREQGGSLIWYVFGSFSGFSATQFGSAGDIPLRGSFDSDGKPDLAVFRPSDRTWWIRRTIVPNTYLTAQFGLAGDVPVPGDYDGDGKFDIAVWRPSDGVWHYLRSINGSYTAFQFGLNGDMPVPGDYDGDGKTDFAVWRPNQNPNESGIFYVQRSTSGFTAFGWGTSDMKIPANSLLSQ